MIFPQFPTVVYKRKFLLALNILLGLYVLKRKFVSLEFTQSVIFFLTSYPTLIVSSSFFG